LKIETCCTCKTRITEPWRVPKSSLVYCDSCAIKTFDQNQKALPKNESAFFNERRTTNETSNPNNASRQIYINFYIFSLSDEKYLFDVVEAKMSSRMRTHFFMRFMNEFVLFILISSNLFKSRSIKHTLSLYLFFRLSILL